MTIGHAGIPAGALGTFRDPKSGAVRFDDWIHRIHIVHNSAVVEINGSFAAEEATAAIATSRCSCDVREGGGWYATATSPNRFLSTIELQR